jgi:DNA-binding SARP family transcriptional activator
MQTDLSRRHQRIGAIDALERPRLFDLLDAFEQSSVVWLVAAGGYGKTTLAMSYARSRDLPAIWLSVPESGLSVGEFFYGLREAAIAVLGPDAMALPVLSPEYAASADIFVRRFAEQLGNCHPGAAILLLDDMHNLASDDPLQALIVLLSNALDKRVRVVIGSRHEPSSAWIRLRSQGQVAFVDERMLVFDEEEMAELLGRQGLSAKALQELLPELEAATGGWAVGLMLLLERWRRTGEVPAQIERERSLAEWFTQEIYEPLPEEDRALLRSCALPTLVPACTVAAATGIADARERLERLAQQHVFIFIDTDGQGARHYRFHDLFRDFLRERAKADESGAAMRALSQHWGRVLWQHGWWSIAAPLLIDVGDQQGLIEGIKQAAGTLLQTGCGDKLYDWLTALPEAERRKEPELRLWEGMCLILHSTVHARALLSSAWEELAERHDYVHMAIAWSGIVDSIWLEWAHVSEYERWITEFLRFEAEFRVHLPLPLWYTVLRGMLTAVGYGKPQDPSLERWEREALTALSAVDLADTERVMLASQLMYLNTWQFGRRSGASRVMTLMQGQREAIERASPLARCLWKTFTSLWALIFEADRDACLREAEEGRELIRSYGISTWDNAVPPLHCALAFGDQEALDEWMGWFLRTENKANRPFYDTFQAHFLSGRAWLQGDLQEALDHAREAVVVGDRHGSIAITATVHAIYAGLLAEAGQFPQALVEAGRTRRLIQGLPSDFVNVLLYLNLAKIPLRRGQSRRALPYVRRAFEAGERQRLFLPLWIGSEDLALMCAIALANGIAPDYARWLIEVRDLAPPAEPVLRQHWPWHCRLNVLGDFVIEVQGQAGDQAASAKQRPRELLSYLILAGPKGLAQEDLAARFWPDSEPEQALNSLYVTLHRLRRGVLGDAEAVVSDGGRARLNPDRVRVDAWEFQKLAAKPKHAEAQVLDAALELYGGAAQLRGVDEIDLETWQVELAAALEAVATQRAGRLEQSDPGLALPIYRQALNHVPLSEALWAGVLRCEAALGDQVALRRSFNLMTKRYQRDAEMEPPPVLEELYKSLTHGAPKDAVQDPVA